MIADYKRKSSYLHRIQRGKCAVCGVPIPKYSSVGQLAHIICKSKVNIEKYGLKIIDSEFNLKLTCAVCNSKVLIGGSREQAIKNHIEKVKGQIAMRELIAKSTEIIDYFGENSRIDKMHEEAVEFIDAWENEPSERIIEEMAHLIHTAVMVWMINPVIRDMVDKTADRTLERIKAGYYNKSTGKHKKGRTDD